MKKRLVLLSTGVGLVSTITEMVKTQAPEIDLYNIVDDSIIATIRNNDNVIPPAIFARMADYCKIAADMGADALLLTCSSVSEALDVAAPLTKLPLFKIDEPMAEDAARLSETAVGVIATLATTMRPTCRLIESKIAQTGKTLAVKAHVCDGAFEAYLRGNSAEHDRIVRESVEALLHSCDYVVLAQASMARAVASMDPNLSARVLSSPESGIRRVVRFLNQGAQPSHS